MNSHFPVTHSILSTKALTTDVLPDYDLGAIVDFRFLNFGLNDTYALKTANGEKYILRAYRAGWRSLSDIAYEMDVLNHLNNKGIPVSKPLPQKDGRLIQTLSAPEGTRYVVLFTYAAGKGPSYDEQAEIKAFGYGKAVAKIHNAAQDFTSQYVRFPLDLDHLIDVPLKSIGLMLSHREGDWVYLQQLSEKIRQRFDELPSDALEQGFCHGDFHGGNAHFGDDGAVTFLILIVVVGVGGHMTSRFFDGQQDLERRKKNVGNRFCGDIPRSEVWTAWIYRQSHYLLVFAICGF